MKRNHWSFSVLVVVIFAGCGEDFAPYNRLTGLRVLAIQADPPAPAAGEMTTFTPLVYTPGEMPDPTLTISWSWCPFAGPATAGYPCLVTEEQLAMLAPGGAPPFDLGTGPTGRFTHNIDPMLLARLCAGVDGSPQLPDCEGGFPVQVKMRARTDSDEVVAVRTLRLRFDPASPANTNPTVDGLAAVIDDAEQSLSDDPTVTLARAVDTIIRATVADTAAEGYPGKKPDGTPGDVRETLTLTWFIESGNTRDAHTKFIENDVPLDRARENRWKPARPKDYPGETSRLIVVVRDSRGGVGWRTAAVRLAP